MNWFVMHAAQRRDHFTCFFHTFFFLATIFPLHESWFSRLAMGICAALFLCGGIHNCNSDPWATCSTTWIHQPLCVGGLNSSHSLTFTIYKSGVATFASAHPATFRSTSFDLLTWFELWSFQALTAAGCFAKFEISSDSQIHDSICDSQSSRHCQDWRKRVLLPTNCWIDIWNLSAQLNFINYI